MTRNQASSFRILAFSDWRSQDFEYFEASIENISDVDLFIYGGDDLNRLIEFESILKRLIAKTKQKKLLFVAGNDDISHEKEEFARRDWTHDLDNEPYFLGCYAFFGNEGSTDGLGFHQRTERQVTSQLQKQTRKVVKEFKNKKYFPIIVSHPPPYGVLDMAIRHSADNLARHIGSKSLKRFLDKHSVPLTICGHVHMWGGRTEVLKNGNQVLNIASHDHSGADGRVAVIDLFTSGKVQITHSSLQKWFSEHEMSCLSALSWKKLYKLKANGIESLADVRLENIDRLIIKGIGVNTARIWIEQAKLLQENAEKLKEGEKIIPRFKIVFPEKLNFLTNEHIVVWDIETDLTQKHIWIIGALDTLSGEFAQFVNLRDERELLLQFTEWLILRENAQLVSYSGTKLEPRTFTNSLKKYGIEDVLNIEKRDVDLCLALRYGCATTASSLQLKELASALGFSYRHPDISGMHVGFVFSEFLRSGREIEDLEGILEYNEDDVRSTNHVLKTVAKQNNIVIPEILK